MKKKAKTLFHYCKIPVKFLILTCFIVKTFFKRKFQALKHSIKGTKAPVPTHVNDFLKSKRIHGCNLDSLASSLQKHKSKSLQVSPFLLEQRSYISKNELLKKVCSMKDETEVLAIPIALTAFSFFRHFVTVIVDKRTKTVEFYDSIGFTTKDYTYATLWGEKCSKEERLQLQELMQHIRKSYTNYSFVENKQVHQKDFNQCAVYVFDRIYKRGVEKLCHVSASKKPLCSNYVYLD